MTTYRLTSNEAVYAPNLVRFAINGARYKKDRQAMINLIAKGWGVPFGAAIKLIRERVPYKVDGETVIFTA